METTTGVLSYVVTDARVRMNANIDMLFFYSMLYSQEGPGPLAEGCPPCNSLVSIAKSDDDEVYNNEYMTRDNDANDDNNER